MDFSDSFIVIFIDYIVSDVIIVMINDFVNEFLSRNMIIAKGIMR